MSAEVLRRAAALMRKHAEAATQGPWEFWSTDSGALEIYVPNGTMSTIGVLEFKDYLDCEECARPSTADASHIASWHPDVALAVADWLEGVAAWADEGLGTAAHLSSTNWPTMWGDVQTDALAVARAYLGETA